MMKNIIVLWSCFFMLLVSCSKKESTEQNASPRGAKPIAGISDLKEIVLSLDGVPSDEFSYLLLEEVLFSKLTWKGIDHLERSFRGFKVVCLEKCTVKYVGEK